MDHSNLFSSSRICLTRVIHGDLIGTTSPIPLRILNYICNYFLYMAVILPIGFDLLSWLISGVRKGVSKAFPFNSFYSRG